MKHLELHIENGMVVPINPIEDETVDVETETDEDLMIIDPDEVYIEEEEQQPEVVNIYP